MSNKKIIFGIAGEIAAGKDTVSAYLVKKYKASFYNFSDPLRDILKRLYKDVARLNLNLLSTGLRQAFGEDYLVEVILKDIEKNKSIISVVSAIRRLKEVESLRKVDNFKLIYVMANEKTRYERLTSRSSQYVDDKIKTFAEFKKDHSLTTEIEITKIKEKADFIIDNSKDLKHLHIQIDEMIKKS